MELSEIFIDPQDEHKHKIKLFFCYTNSQIIPQEFIKGHVFKGDNMTSFIVLKENGEIHIWIGLGDKDKIDPLGLYRSGAHAVENVVAPRNFPEVYVPFSNEDLDNEAVFFLSEGLLASSLYSYTLKTYNTNTMPRITFDISKKSIVQTAYLVAQSRNIAKELVDTPPNICHPLWMAEYVKKNLGHLDMTVEVWDKEKLKEENMQGLLHVGRGSSYEPVMVRVEYKGKDANKKVCLIGKGITYDSGGYSIKPNESMKSMKADMGGAAAVIAVLYGIATMNLPIDVVAYIPLTENLINGLAYKPGDVITFRNGKTVEVTNTDAEGRLILADALILASEEKYDLVIDIATLTGAIITALGNDIHGVFSNKPGKRFAESYTQFTLEKTCENAWMMPLFQAYRSNLKSAIADLQNQGTREGAVINAALFLNEFVAEDQPWVHLDIAGAVFQTSKDGTGKATGRPIEALLLYLGSRFLEL